MELGCGMEGYIELKPVLKGSLDTGPGVGAGPGVPGVAATPPQEVWTVDSGQRALHG